MWSEVEGVSRVRERIYSKYRNNLTSTCYSEYKDLQRLSLLPSLKNVSFDDIHFGSCPVTRLDGYRNFALCYLKQVTHLDGLEVTNSDRASAEDAYMESIMKFNQRVEEVTREGGREALAIEARRARTKSHGDALKLEMVSAFDLLERLVREGLQGVSNEYERQIKVRKQNQMSLENNLKDLARNFADEVDKQLLVEKNREKTEERAFSLIEARTIAERDQALMISELQYNNNGFVNNENNINGSNTDGKSTAAATEAATISLGLTKAKTTLQKHCVACQYIGDHQPGERACP